MVHRYVAPLFRSGSVGEPDAGCARLEAAVRASLEILIDGLRPGVAASDLHDRSARSFRRHGFEVGHRSGYSVGVNYAPDWGEGTLLSIQPGERRALEPGMVFHLVPGIYVPGRHAIVISETVAVTAEGCETDHRLPARAVRGVEPIEAILDSGAIDALPRRTDPDRSDVSISTGDRWET